MLFNKTSKPWCLKIIVAKLEIKLDAHINNNIKA